MFLPEYFSCWLKSKLVRLWMALHFLEAEGHQELDVGGALA